MTTGYVSVLEPKGKNASRVLLKTKTRFSKNPRPQMFYSDDGAGRREPAKKQEPQKTSNKEPASGSVKL